MGGKVMSFSKPDNWHKKAFVSLGISVQSSRWCGGDENKKSVRHEFEVSFAEPVADHSGFFSESSKVDANHFGAIVGGSLADMLWSAIEREMPCPEKAMMSARSAFFDRVDEIVDQIEMIDKAEREDLEHNGGT
jgi:hypothetical protein